MPLLISRCVISLYVELTPLSSFRCLRDAAMPCHISRRCHTLSFARHTPPCCRVAALFRYCAMPPYMLRCCRLYYAAIDAAASACCLRCHFHFSLLIRFRFSIFSLSLILFRFRHFIIFASIALMFSRRFSRFIISAAFSCVYAIAMPLLLIFRCFSIIYATTLFVAYCRCIIFIAISYDADATPLLRHITLLLLSRPMLRFSLADVDIA